MSRFAVDLARLLAPQHMLSLSRLLLAALLWVAPDDPLFVLLVVSFAITTDAVDGFLGRRRPEGTGAEDVGSWLDPLCDKGFALSAAILVVVIWDAPWIILPLLLLRDAAILLLAALLALLDPARFAAQDFHGRLLGQATTVLQIVTVVAVVAWSVSAVWFAIATAAVGAAAIVDRVVVVAHGRGRTLPAEPGPFRGAAGGP